MKFLEMIILDRLMIQTTFQTLAHPAYRLQRNEDCTVRGSCRRDARFGTRYTRIAMPKSPTARFSDRVENYVRYRPGYPPEVLDLLRAECGLQPSHIVADIASGTGMFTRLLLENGNSVFAVEPNTEMREIGIHQLESYNRLVSVAGTAEETTLGSASVDFVTAAQAAHWFDLPRARAEFVRILQAGGMVRADLE